MNHDPSSSIAITESENKNPYPLLEEKQLKLLENSQQLREMLRSTRLQKHLREIEYSENRQESLKKARNNNPDFEEFVRLMLREINPS